jgi:cholesterol oxidase
MIDGMKKIADEIEPNGSRRVIAPTWKEKPSDSTLILLHPLGGCPMGDDVDAGVVNSYGQVFQPDSKNKKNVYKNFYLMDGSIIPMAVGVNPSLTISAISFRCVEHLIQNLK